MAERVDHGDHRRPRPTEMSLGILGGTGPLGRGLASRFAGVVRTVQIGSRDADRAEEAASSVGGGVRGVTNEQACDSDVVVVAVPWSAHDAVLQELAGPLRGRIVIDAVNPLGFDDRGAYVLHVDAGSATQRAQQLLPGSIVLGAFHHVAASELRSGEQLDTDVLVVGDDDGAVAAATALIDAAPGLRGVYAGRLRSAGQVEALTANIIAINRRYRIQAGVKVTGLQ